MTCEVFVNYSAGTKAILKRLLGWECKRAKIPLNYQEGQLERVANFAILPLNSAVLLRTTFFPVGYEEWILKSKQ